jgi:hypothetical protein
LEHRDYEGFELAFASAHTLLGRQSFSPFGSAVGATGGFGTLAIATCVLPETTSTTIR